MTSWMRAVRLGLASWLIPFAFGFLLFPLKKANGPLFVTLMMLIVLVTAGGLFELYFRSGKASVAESLRVGFLWFAINVVLDFPMFARGPMQMSAAAYYSEIGLIYLIYPMFGFWASRLARPHPL